MLVLTAAQYARFQRQAETSTEYLAHAHIREHFSEMAAVLGEDGTAQLLSRALRQARKLGLDLQPEVMQYVSLVFEFGSQFPDGPGFGWAQSILGDGLPDRLLRVFNAGLQRAAGATGGHHGRQATEGGGPGGPAPAPDAAELALQQVRADMRATMVFGGR